MAKQTFWKDLVFPTEQPVKFNNVIGLELPRGIVAERPDVVAEGTLRFNTTSGVTELFQGGVWQAIPTSLSIGEINTGVNVGAGVGLYKQKSGTELEFKTVVAGTNITLSEASNTVTISAATVGEVNTASNIGAGTAHMYSRKIGSDLQFRSIRSVSPYLSAVDNGDVIELDTTLIPGEVNTGSNIGVGLGLYYGKNSSELQFKSIQAISPVAFIDNTTSISIGLEANPVIAGTGAITLPKGTSAQRPGTPVSGMLRYNSSNNQFEGYVSNTWIGLLTGATAVNKTGDTMTGSLNMAAGSNITIASGDMNITSGGLILSSGNITVSGNINVDGSINAHTEVLNIGDIVSTGDITVSGTVNGRDLDSDGAIIDQFDILGGGLIAKSGGSFVSRTVSADTANDKLGVSVLNGSGSGNLAIGLDIAGRSAVAELSASDELLVYASGVNRKSTIDDVAVYIDNRTLIVDSISDLRNLNTTTGRYNRFTNVQLMGYYTPGDGGGGLFRKDVSDTTSVDDTGVCIVSSDGVRWKRFDFEEIKPEFFGAIGDGVADDYYPLINACRTGISMKLPVKLARKTYRIALAALQITEGPFILRGEPGTVLLKNHGSNGFRIQPTPSPFTCAAGSTSTTVKVAGVSWATNEHAGKWAQLITSPFNQFRRIISNTSDTLTLQFELDVLPTAGQTVNINAPVQTVHMENVEVRAVSGGSAGISMLFADDITMYNVISKGHAGNACSINSSRNVRVEGGIFSNSQFGLFIHNSDNVQVIGARGENNSGAYQIQLKDCRDSAMIDCHSVGGNDVGLDIKCSGLNPAWNLSMIGCTANGSGTAGLKAHCMLEEGSTFFPQGFRISNCTAIGCNTGLQASSSVGTGRNLSIDGITALDCSQVGIALQWDGCTLNNFHTERIGLRGLQVSAKKVTVDGGYIIDSNWDFASGFDIRMTDAEYCTLRNITFIKSDIRSGSGWMLQELTGCDNNTYINFEHKVLAGNHQDALSLAGSNSQVIRSPGKIVSKTSAYTAVPSDSMILCDATSGEFTITLPSAVLSKGARICIKKTDASANKITIATTGSQVIDGASTKEITNRWDHITIQSNGTNWFVIGNHP